MTAPMLISRSNTVTTTAMCVKQALPNSERQVVLLEVREDGTTLVVGARYHATLNAWVGVATGETLTPSPNGRFYWIEQPILSLKNGEAINEVEYPDTVDEPVDVKEICAMLYFSMVADGDEPIKMNPLDLIFNLLDKKYLQQNGDDIIITKAGRRYIELLKHVNVKE